MIISNRLKQVADFVDKSDKVIDVGCDHALLDIYLVLNNKNKLVVASDINEKPLIAAKTNIKKYNLEKRIKVVKQDGIEHINNDIDTIVISGMGSTTIINLLFKDKSKLKNINKIIISSNNDYYKLRKAFNRNGYKIKDEKIILENGKFYPIICYVKGYELLSIFKLKYGKVLLKEKEDTYIKYINKEKNKLLKIYNSLSNKYIIKKIFIKIELNLLNKI